VNKRILLNICKYLLAFVLLGIVIYRNWAPEKGKGLSDVWQQHVVEGKPIQGGYLLAAIVAYSVAALITFVRWFVLVRAQDLPFRLFDALRLGLVGFFFNNILPSSIGGDVIKAAVLVREQSRRTVAVATIVMDRLIALWAMFWFVAALGSVFWLAGSFDQGGGEQSKTIVLIAIGLCVVSLVVWLLLGRLPQHRADRFAGRLEGLRRVGPALAEVWRTVWMYRCRQKSVVLAMALSCLVFVGLSISYYCCVLVLRDGTAGDPIPTLEQHFLIVPVGLLILALPLFPGGAGIGELGYGVLYSWFGCDPASGVLGMLVQRVIIWMLGLIGYFVYLSMRTSLSTPEPASTSPAEEPLVTKAPGGRPASTGVCSG
jgi:uncharacterized protein (TIRG00374 family)